MDVIRGNLVELRPIGSGDLSALRRWWDDPETMRFWAMPAAFLTDAAFDADLRGRFSRFDRAGYFMVVVDNRPIGRIDFEQLDETMRSAEVMILIGEPEERGKGHGTDAMIALLRYLFHQRGLHRVALTVIAWNDRAIRSYEKLGFRTEGWYRDDLFFEGRFHDQIAMSILRPEFDALWS
jgi:RimJ/RimL family protein N-acetyltransferase